MPVATSTSTSCAKGIRLLVDPDTDEMVAVPTWCHLWTCPRCSQFNYLKVRALIRAGAPEREITLTMRPLPDLSLRRRIDFFRRCLTRLVAKIRRSWGTFEYFAAIELHQSGSPHMHLLQRGAYVDQAWLSRTWAELTGGSFVTWIKDARSDQAHAHVAKYLTKSAPVISLIRPRCRAYTTSQHWSLAPAVTDPDAPSRYRPLLYVSLGISDVVDVCFLLGITLIAPASASGLYRFAFPRHPRIDHLQRILHFQPRGRAKLALLLMGEFNRVRGSPHARADALDEIDFAYGPVYG